VPYGRLSLELDLISQIWLTNDRLNHQLASQAGHTPPPSAQPKVGEPDPEARIALRQWLQTTPLGRSLLCEARASLRTLQAGQDHTVAHCGEVEILVSQHQFERRVLIPAIAQLNRELNHFFSRMGLAVQNLDRVVLSGEAVRWPTFETWLRQKCPNATIERPMHDDQRTTEITAGLADLIETVNLDREFNLDRQRYDAYFVFHELLCNLPQQAMTQREARTRLERAGIPLPIVDRHLPELLTNHLPPGLIPAAPLSTWLDPDSIAHPIYQVLRESALFEAIVSPDLSHKPQPKPKSNPQPKFQPKFQHIAWMRQYLYCLTMSTAQTFQDPLCLNPVSSTRGANFENF
jgi:hypothetical protein